MRGKRNANPPPNSTYDNYSGDYSMTDVEVAVYLDDILKIFGWSRAKFFKNLPELKSAGVVFNRYQGRPPKRRLCAFPSRIQAWISLKASKDEMI